MANEVSITVKGLDDVLDRFSELPKDLVCTKLARALATASVPIVEAVEPRIPVKSGLLAANLKTTIAIHVEAKGGQASIGFTGDQAHVARFVEYGHRQVGHKPENNELGTVESHPFLRPAAAASAEKAVEVFKETLLASLAEDNQ